MDSQEYPKSLLNQGRHAGPSDQFAMSAQPFETDETSPKTSEDFLEDLWPVRPQSVRELGGEASHSVRLGTVRCSLPRP